MADTLSTMIDGNEVIVDVSGLAGVAHPALLLPAIVVAVVATVVVFAHARADQRPFLFGAMASGTLGTAAALLSAPIVFGRIAAWVDGLSERITDGTGLVGLCGFACGALLWIIGVAIVVMPRPRAAAVTIVGVVVFVVGVGGVARVQAQRRTFIRSLQQAFPVPLVVFDGQDASDPVAGPLPEVQVGRVRLLRPITWRQLGAPPATVLGLANPAAVAFPAADVANWNLDEVRATLQADTAGEHATTALASQGPVSVRSTVRFRAVDDRSPRSLTLTPGVRLEFAKLSGPVGTTAAALKKRKQAAADVVVSVEADRVVDGFRTATVHISDNGQQRTEEIVAKNGALYRTAGDLFVGDDCGLPFLGHDTCRCGREGVESCTRVDADSLGAMVRVGLLIASFGMSEVLNTCDGCGDGHEVGLLRLR